MTWEKWHICKLTRQGCATWQPSMWLMRQGTFSMVTAWVTGSDRCLCIAVNVVERRISLVPVFGFGENDLYKQVSNPPGSRLRKFQSLMTKLLTFSLPLFHGRGVFNYTFGLLPFRRRVTVVGELSSGRFQFIVKWCNVEAQQTETETLLTRAEIQLRQKSHQSRIVLPDLKSQFSPDIR